MRVLESTSLWCDAGTSDKVYNIQLIEVDDGTFRVDTQYGARELVIKGQWQGRSFKAPNGKDAKGSEGIITSKYRATQLYNELLCKKAKRGYDKKISTIMPPEYTGGVVAAFVSKEELSKLAKSVKGLKDFLTNVAEEEIDRRDAFEILAASMDD